MINLIYSCILVIFVVLIVILALACLKRLFNETEKTESDKKVTVRCPKCGDTYNILKMDRFHLNCLVVCI